MATYFNPMMFTDISSSAYKPYGTISLPNMPNLFTNQQQATTTVNTNKEFKVSTTATAKTNTAKFIADMLSDSAIKDNFNKYHAGENETYAEKLNKLLKEFAEESETTLSNEDFATLQRIANDYAKYGKISANDISIIKNMIDEKYTNETVSETAARAEAEQATSLKANELNDINNKYIPSYLKNEDITDSDIRTLLTDGEVELNDRYHVVGDWQDEEDGDTLTDDAETVINKVINVIIEDMKTKTQENGQTWTTEMNNIANELRKSYITNLEFVYGNGNDTKHKNLDIKTNNNGICDYGQIKKSNSFLGVDFKGRWTDSIRVVVDPVKLAKKFKNDFLNKCAEAAHEEKMKTSDDYQKKFSNYLTNISIKNNELYSVPWCIADNGKTTIFKKNPLRSFVSNNMNVQPNDLFYNSLYKDQEYELSSEDYIAIDKTEIQ